MTNNILSAATVIKEHIAEERHDQRVDNYLLKRFRNVPKSHLYQLLRSGQVRVNGKRINASYRLQTGDILRIPPIRTTENNIFVRTAIAPANFFPVTTIYEDDVLLAIDKPSGMAVHGGSGVSFGVIEQLRAQNSAWKFLELVHRLDRETSGVLLLAKKRSALVELHRQIRQGLIKKHYLAMVKGQWRNTQQQHVKIALKKYVAANGERRVTVATGEHSGSKAAHTIITLRKSWENFSLLAAEIKTGRTHQIRVHLAHLGFPIAGDDKYGDFEINRQLAKANNRQPKLPRMFLHAHLMQIMHPVSGAPLKLQSPLPGDLQKFVDSLDKAGAADRL